MGFAGYNQDDGTPKYTSGDYKIRVSITVTYNVTVEADPNDDDSIEMAVEEWMNDYLTEDIYDWDYEIEDVDEVKE